MSKKESNPSLPDIKLKPLPPPLPPPKRIIKEDVDFKKWLPEWCKRG
jgi:hypothetical protein